MTYGLRTIIKIKYSNKKQVCLIWPKLNRIESRFILDYEQTGEYYNVKIFIKSVRSLKTNDNLMAVGVLGTKLN